MPQSYHIFVKRGDARDEVDAILRELGTGTPSSKGFHKMLHVSRAAQTVVFVDSPSAPLADALRGRQGWEEPEQGTSTA